jgi:hypothetical protein
VLRAGVLASLFAIAAPDGNGCSNPPDPAGDNGVNVKPIHRIHYATGSAADPIQVTRDNPWFKGYYSGAPNGSYGNATGLYSNVFDAKCGVQGFGSVETFEFSGTDEVDYWVTKLRPPEGTEKVSSGNPDLLWEVRTGNLVPGNRYALGEFNCAGQTASPTWVRLADNIAVVPVVLISFHTTAPAAGTDAEQDFRNRGRVLFDFIPFTGQHTSTAPAGWNAKNTDDPVGTWAPPDDIWAQCGIQFQVIAVFQFDRDETLTNCDSQADHFLNVNNRKSTLTAVVGPDVFARLDALNPVYAYFGWVNCTSWLGNHLLSESTVEINRRFSPVEGPYTVAHELGHVLWSPNHVKYMDDPTNLMSDAEPVLGTKLTSDQCATASQTAEAFSARYATYNEAIGRVVPPPEAPPEPPPKGGPASGHVSSQIVCCEDANGGLYWQLFPFCPTVLSSSSCVECCILSTSPLTVANVKLGTCDNTDHDPSECDVICCQLPGVNGIKKEMPRAECTDQGGWDAGTQCPPG